MVASYADETEVKTFFLRRKFSKLEKDSKDLKAIIAELEQKT